jgi:hypothetical protein
VPPQTLDQIALEYGGVCVSADEGSPAAHESRDPGLEIVSIAYDEGYLVVELANGAVCDVDDVEHATFQAIVDAERRRQMLDSGDAK